LTAPDELTQALESTAAKADRLPIHQKSDLQKVLIDALAGVLKVKPSEIDIAKNFDEYGLDSIDAVIATEWIGNRLGIVLPPEFLFVFRSIDAVTNALLAGDYRKASLPSRPLTQTPIFLFGGGGGADGPGLIRFREQAAPRLAFEVVQIDKWHDWVDHGLKFEDLATRAAQYVNEKAPQGPIRLAGYSQGGQLAYATALTLEDMGRVVDLVFLLDTSADVIYRTSASNPNIFSGAIIFCRDYIVAKIRGGNFFPPRHKLFHFAAWLWEHRGGPELITMVVRFKRAVLPGGNRIRGDNFIQIRVFARLWGDWTEKNKARVLHRTTVVLFRSEDPGSPDLGWKTYCSNLTVIPVKGDHHSMLTSEGLIGHFITEVGHLEAR
jgi:thioesterase domain-containing protein/acyl carrier protein